MALPASRKEGFGSAHDVDERFAFQAHDNLAHPNRPQRLMPNGDWAVPCSLGAGRADPRPALNRAPISAGIRNAVAAVEGPGRHQDGHHMNDPLERYGGTPMCLNCGCGEPETRHKDTDITLDDVRNASAGAPMDQTVQNMRTSLEKMGQSEGAQMGSSMGQSSSSSQSGG